MARSRQAERQRRFKELGRLSKKRSLTPDEDAELSELFRLGAAQYDDHHIGLWTMLRKRAKKIWKRKKADQQFDPDGDD